MAAVSAVRFERWIQYDGTNADEITPSIAQWPGALRGTDENGVMDIDWFNNAPLTVSPGQWVRLDSSNVGILDDADFQAQYIVQ